MKDLTKILQFVKVSAANTTTAKDFESIPCPYCDGTAEVTPKITSIRRVGRRVRLLQWVYLCLKCKETYTTTELDHVLYEQYIHNLKRK